MVLSKRLLALAIGLIESAKEPTSPKEPPMPAPNELPEAVLLPCPFCGGAATRGVSRMAEWSTPTYWTGCEPCNLAFIGKGVNTRETADADWNRRAAGDGREGDARRYRWLRDRADSVIDWDFMPDLPANLPCALDMGTSATLDAAIDTAMGAGQEGKGDAR